MCVRFSHWLSKCVEMQNYFTARCAVLPPPLRLLSARPSVPSSHRKALAAPDADAISAPPPPPTSSPPSSPVSKSRPSHKGKLLVHNRPRPDVRFCGLMVVEEVEEVEVPMVSVSVGFFFNLTLKLCGGARAAARSESSVGCFHGSQRPERHLDSPDNPVQTAAVVQRA